MTTEGGQQRTEGGPHQLLRGTAKIHPSLRGYSVSNTTAFHWEPINKPHGFEPAQYPQAIEIKRPISEERWWEQETLWFDVRQLPRKSWVQPTDQQGNGLPLQIYLEDMPGTDEVAVYYEWL
jgi:hypothetical protein